MIKSVIKKRLVAPVAGERATRSPLTTRSLDAPEAPTVGLEMDHLANYPVDERELASAREKIREQKYEIEALNAALSGSQVERLTAELSASYATNRELGRQLEEERGED